MSFINSQKQVAILFRISDVDFCLMTVEGNISASSFSAIRDYLKSHGYKLYAA